MLFLRLLFFLAERRNAVLITLAVLETCIIGHMSWFAQPVRTGDRSLASLVDAFQHTECVVVPPGVVTPSVVPVDSYIGSALDALRLAYYVGASQVIFVGPRTKVVALLSHTEELVSSHAQFRMGLSRAGQCPPVEADDGEVLPNPTLTLFPLPPYRLNDYLRLFEPVAQALIDAHNDLVAANSSVLSLMRSKRVTLQSFERPTGSSLRHFIERNCGDPSTSPIAVVGKSDAYKFGQLIKSFETGHRVGVALRRTTGVFESPQYTTAFDPEIDFALSEALLFNQQSRFNGTHVVPYRHGRSWLIPDAVVAVSHAVVTAIEVVYEECALFVYEAMILSYSEAWSQLLAFFKGDGMFYGDTSTIGGDAGNNKQQNPAADDDAAAGEGQTASKHTHWIWVN